ncbi:hypothetical protein BJ138DRAFT_1166360 [Hygrophoropsis aurantiaca]|uniref:Uncharacterized protein n=1 Tax=Hygrophoropsis aurantiaca TaxID=72124 RepID=A0ACB7ZTR0_9AGAM|nr:hypothetical protein BJ138DRAFT_1166360 [Hygrophoropsis aurantiaca]
MSVNRNLHVGNHNRLACATGITRTWTIEPRGRDTYVLGSTTNVLVANFPGQTGRPVSAIPRNNQNNQRWILDPNPIRSISASSPETAVAEDRTRYTSGTPGTIIVQNNLSRYIYAAVSSRTPGVGQTWQFYIAAGSRLSWTRPASETVHVSTGVDLGTFRTYVGRVGSTVNIDDLTPNPEWNGVTSIAAANARYVPGSAGWISVQNNLRFSIYVAVMTSVWGSGQTGQFIVYPGTTESWSRYGSEVVLVSMASAPGIVQAYTGRIGSTLIIDS